MPQATVRSSPPRMSARTSSSEQPSSAETSRTVRGSGLSMFELYVESRATSTAGGRVGVR